MRYVARHNKGFTLIELLVVMAISIILMGLVLYPVYQSFVITRQAQAMVDSQDAARTALQMISRELGQAMYVYDNAQLDITTFATGLTPEVATGQTPIMLPVAQPGGTTQWVVLPYAKIDFILPKLLMHCNNSAHPSGDPRDYPRDIQVGTRIELRDWPPCPYCSSTNVEARPKTPLEQDSTIVRYFLACRRNDLGAGTPANMGWVSPWGKNVEEGTQNQVILYRVEFNPRDDTLFPAGMTVAERLMDPLFFYRPATAQRWMDISRVVGIGKYEDLVTSTKDASGTVLTVHPTIAFRMASIENDTFAPAYDTDKVNEYSGAPPNVFSGSYGYWTPGSRIEVMRGNYSADPPGGVDYFTTTNAAGERIVMKRVPDPGGWIDTIEFNITEYEELGYVNPPSSGTLEMAFTLNANKGTVNFALQPPRKGLATTGPVCTFDPAIINQAFRDQYALDRYGARRNVLVSTLDPTVTAQYLQNARVVPGSDKVIGPDMVFGPHFGQPVRYERIPLGLRYPAQNQYQIDCDTGWIMFSPDPNLDLPETSSIDVYYLVYFNQTDDVVRGDYLTKSLINIQLGMRMFDPEGGKPYPVDLNNSVKVRNALR